MVNSTFVVCTFIRYFKNEAVHLDGKKKKKKKVSFYILLYLTRKVKKEQILGTPWRIPEETAYSRRYF